MRENTPRVAPVEGRPAFELAMLEVAHAYERAGVRERRPNQGPVIDRVLALVGLRRPSPWCTAMAVAMQHEAAALTGNDSACPLMASGAKLWRWSLRHPGLAMILTAAHELRVGDVVIMGSSRAKRARIARGKLASGHTYTVIEAASPAGEHGSAEGNTSVAGSREGDGFYLRRRQWTDPRVVGALRFRLLPRVRATGR